MNSMKRVTYISRFSRQLSREEIQQIAEVSIRNNQRDELTGVLFTYRDVFYQIIEGPEEKLDARLAKIFNDERHRDLFVLKVELNIDKRAYSDWAMKTVVLDESEDYLMRPVSEMLGSMTDTWLILEKYTPEKVIRSIQHGENPLEEKVAPVTKIILFGDLFSSTTFGEKLSSSLFYDILETFLSIAIETIHSHGGTVSKLLGDGLMAVFNADQTEASLEAVREISAKLKKLRSSRPANDPFSLLFGGFGISSGRVLEGNVGSVSKKDYTYLGDAVNTAARLQSVTRKVGRSVVFDESLIAAGHLSNIQQIGRYKPRGKDTELKLYSLTSPEVQIELTYEDLQARIRDLAHNI